MSATNPRAESAKPAKHDERGLTLIELMITVALIGTLASIALPYQKKFRARSQRAEAIVALKGIHTAQTVFYAEVDRYSNSFQEIGFELSGGVLVNDATIDGKSYRFEIGTYPYEGKNQGNFWATATGDLLSESGVMDVLLIENHAVIKE